MTQNTMHNATRNVKTKKGQTPSLARFAELARTSAKGAQVFRHLTQYMAHASLGKLTIRDRDERLSFYANNVAKYCRRLIGSLEIEVEVIGRNEELMRDRNFLFVCNHMSYLDILVTSPIQPAVFVTSVEMQRTPFLGQLCELGGSIFVERRHRSRIEQDLGTMVETLKKGHNILIYPEGTSTDGQKLLPFKKSLLMAAVQAEVEVLPLCLKYVEIDGEQFGPHNADTVCWHGEMTFAPHFLNLMSARKVKAELHFLEPIKVTPTTTRHELADRAYEMIHATYNGKSTEADAKRWEKSDVETTPVTATVSGA